MYNNYIGVITDIYPPSPFSDALVDEEVAMSFMPPITAATEGLEGVTGSVVIMDEIDHLDRHELLLTTLQTWDYSQDAILVEVILPSVMSQMSESETPITFLHWAEDIITSEDLFKAGLQSIDYLTVLTLTLAREGLLIRRHTPTTGTKVFILPHPRLESSNVDDFKTFADTALTAIVEMPLILEPKHETKMFDRLEFRVDEATNVIGNEVLVEFLVEGAVRGSRTVSLYDSEMDQPHIHVPIVNSTSGASIATRHLTVRFTHSLALPFTLTGMRISYFIQTKRKVEDD